MRGIFGWDLPPGVTSADIERQFTSTCIVCHEDAEDDDVYCKGCDESMCAECHQKYDGLCKYCDNPQE